MVRKTEPAGLIRWVEPGDPIRDAHLVQRWADGLLTVLLNAAEPDDFPALLEGVSSRQRKFKGPWSDRELTQDERDELCGVHGLFERYFWDGFGSLGPPTMSQFTWRPMQTGPEPMHWDKEDGAVVTGFLNISREPRVWNVGPLRKKTGKPFNPPDGCFSERVEFPPGAMWIVCAERRAHQIVSGAGAAQFNWHLM